jgi:hypothetical protein
MILLMSGTLCVLLLFVAYMVGQNTPSVQPKKSTPMDGLGQKMRRAKRLAESLRAQRNSSGQEAEYSLDRRKKASSDVICPSCHEPFTVSFVCADSKLFCPHCDKAVEFALAEETKKNILFLAHPTNRKSRLPRVIIVTTVAILTIGVSGAIGAKLYARHRLLFDQARAREVAERMRIEEAAKAEVTKMKKQQEQERLRLVERQAYLEREKTRVKTPKELRKIARRASSLTTLGEIIDGSTDRSLGDDPEEIEADFAYARGLRRDAEDAEKAMSKKADDARDARVKSAYDEGLRDSRSRSARDKADDAKRQSGAW